MTRKKKLPASIDLSTAPAGPARDRLLRLLDDLIEELDSRTPFYLPHVFTPEEPRPLGYEDVHLVLPQDVFKGIKSRLAAPKGN